MEEHVKFGLCLDGQCGRRAKWEDVTLLRQDQRRLGHGGGPLSPTHLPLPQCQASPSSRAKSSSGRLAAPVASLDMTMSHKTLRVIEELRSSLRPGETPDFSPLKTASLRGDFFTVVQLCALGTDINERDK